MIYVASSWRNLWQPAVVELLRADGHEVYDFRQPGPGNNGFHWSEIDPSWQLWTPDAFREGLRHPLAVEGFATDMKALRNSSACLLVLPCGNSAHLELGWAVGARKQTAVLFPVGLWAERPGCGDVEPELMLKMADDVLVDVEELRTWSHELKRGAL
jgi:hypothetical protein